MELTNIQEVAQKHGVQELELPGWDDATPFVCRAKRPSLFNMASMGFIPNPLLDVVSDLFTPSLKKIEKIPLAKQASAMIQMAKYALVEPTYEELDGLGLTLTDDQLMAIYAFAVGGAAALEPFRAILRAGFGDGGDNVQRKTRKALANSRPIRGVVSGSGDSGLHAQDKGQREAAPCEDRQQ